LQILYSQYLFILLTAMLSALIESIQCCYDLVYIFLAYVIFEIATYLLTYSLHLCRIDKSLSDDMTFYVMPRS